MRSRNKKTWQRCFSRLFLEPLFAGSLWPCWLLWEIKQEEQMALGGLVSQQVKLKDAHIQQFNTRVASRSASLLFLRPQIWLHSLLSVFLKQARRRSSATLRGLTDWSQTGVRSLISSELNHLAVPRSLLCNFLQDCLSLHIYLTLLWCTSP